MGTAFSRSCCSQRQLATVLKRFRKQLRICLGSERLFGLSPLRRFSKSCLPHYLFFVFVSPPLTQLRKTIRGAAQALENANDISEGIASDHLKALLEVNLPKGSKKKRVVLGITDKNLAGSIKAAFPGVDCETNEVVQDLLRGLRLHGPKLLKQLQEGDMDRAQLGLGHAYSRAKVKFSVQKNDNHIIQSIALLDTLDKDINTFSMRIRYIPRP